MSNNRQTAMANCEIIVLPRTVRQKNYAPHSTLISEKYEVIEIKTVHKNGYRSLNRSQLFVLVQKEFLFAKSMHYSHEGGKVQFDCARLVSNKKALFKFLK